MSRPDGLELLEADIRASAPRMSPELERRLEAIVARPPRRVRTWRPALAAGLAAVLVAAAVAVVAVTRSGDGASQVAPLQSSGSASSDATATPAPGPPAAAVVTRARRVERDAALTLAAPSRSFGDVSDAVAATT